MALIKLQPKGQMTIPAEIWDQLQLQRGPAEASTDGRATGFRLATRSPITPSLGAISKKLALRDGSGGLTRSR